MGFDLKNLIKYKENRSSKQKQLLIGYEVVHVKEFHSQEMFFVIYETIIKD